MSNATKIVLGKRPQSFSKTVECEMLGGGTGAIGWDFKYRTRTELAELRDELQAARRMQIEAEIDAIQQAAAAKAEMPETSATQRTKQDIAMNVDLLLKAANGWDLGVKFDRDALEQLADEVPGAILAAMAAYSSAIDEGRAGN